MAVIATHPRATDRNLAAVEADLAFGSAPALPHSVAAPAMRFAGELLGILAQHLLNSFNPSRQTKALKRAVHMLPSRRKAGHERERWGHGSDGHGVALLCGFGTPSLTAQGGQRLHPYFNNGRDIPQQPWLHVAGWMLVGFVAGLWLDGLLRKLDYTRVEKRKALGAEMAKLGNYLGQISLNSLSLRKKMRGLCHALPLLRSSGYGRLMVEHSHFRPLVPGA